MSENNTPLRSEDNSTTESRRAAYDFFLPEESDNGNAEYKYYILPATADRFDRLVTQLRWRLNEGDGSCLYEIGVLDDGTPEGITMDCLRESLSYLCAMAQVLGARVTLRRLLYRNGASLYTVQSREEAYRELQLDRGLPYAPVVRSTPPSDMLHIDLIPSPGRTTEQTLDKHLTHAVIQSSATSNSSLPSVTDCTDGGNSTISHHRRTLRLARFEAAIREGAGCTQRQESYRHHGPLRQPCPSDGLAIKWCAEVAVQHEGFFVDYLSLPC